VACGEVSAVVFDMDGTLIDSTSCVTAAYRDAVLAAGGEEYTANEVVALYPKGPPRTILGLLLRRVATARDERLYLDALQRHRSSIAVYDGVIDVLEMLVAASVPIAVFTGASSTAARQLLADAGLVDLFAFVLGSDAVTRPKPAPDGILRACALLAVAPVNTAYVGDSPLDLEAARRSGAMAIAAGWGHLFDPTANSDLVAMSPREVLQCLKAM